MRCLNAEILELQKPALRILKDMGVEGRAFILGTKFLLVTSNYSWQVSLGESHKRLLEAIARFQEKTGTRITQVSWRYLFVTNAGYQEKELDLGQ